MENTQDQVVDTPETTVEDAEVTTEVDTTEETTEEINPLEEAQKALEQREKELFQREVKAELKESGLEQFAEIINVSNEAELKETIKKLTSIMNDLKVSMSYQPTENTKQDSYTVAKQNGDSRSMIKALFGNR